MKRNSQYDEDDVLIKPPEDAFGGLWKTRCPACGIIHGKHWHIETDRCLKCQKPKQIENMHYKNGREAKNGDRVVLIPSFGPPVAGILYDAVPGNNMCNGRIAQVSYSDPVANLSECLHVDDVAKATVPDTTKAPPVDNAHVADGCAKFAEPVPA